MARPPVALVHDYLTQRGGAERVVLSMVRTFPDAALHTSLFAPDATFAAFSEARVRPLPINALAPLRRHHRLALPLLAPAFSRALVDAEVTLVSSSGWAHGIGVTGRKVVYCHAPARWLYQSQRYLGGGGGPARAALALLSGPLRRWDRRAAGSADRYLCNSQITRARVRECYRIDAEVLHPPPTLDPLGPAIAPPGLDPGFLLCVSRLLPYKNLDVVIGAAARRPRIRLVIAGEGPEEGRLRSGAPANVRFLGGVGDAELRWLYASCVGLLAASHEDFGLTPLEAASFGRPVAALRAGGYLDTVAEAETGLFFDRVEVEQVVAAIDRLTAETFDSAAIRRWAARFDEAAFGERLRAIVGEEAAAA